MGTDGLGGGTGPPAVGVRVGWDQVPGWVRDEVEGRLGGRVVEAATQATGFSPGLAVRVRLEDGRRAFVKAVGPEPNPDSPEAHRAEARTMGVLPRSAPATRRRSPPPWPPGPATLPPGPACRRRPACPPCGPSSGARPWSPSTGCAAGPAGTDGTGVG